MSEFESNAVLANRIAELQRENSKLQQERNELAATVEALRVAWEAVKATDWDKPLEEVFAATPQQHLRDVRAEAGRDGFIAGYNQAQSDPFISNDTEIDLYADEYAESVRAGE